MRFSVLFALLLLSASYPRQAWSADADYDSILQCSLGGQRMCQLELGKAYAFGNEKWNLAPNYEKALYWLNQTPSQESGIEQINAVEIIAAIKDYQKTGSTRLLEGNRPLKVADQTSPNNLDNAEEASAAFTQERAREIVSRNAAEKQIYQRQGIAGKISGLENVTGLTIGVIAATVAITLALFLAIDKAHLALPYALPLMSLLTRQGKQLIGNKKVRVGIAVYFLWVLGVVYVSVFIFKDRYTPERLFHLGLVPAVFLVIAGVAYQWIQNPNLFSGVKNLTKSPSAHKHHGVPRTVIRQVAFYLMRSVFFVVVSIIVLGSLITVAQMLGKPAMTYGLLYASILPFVAAAMYSKPLGIAKKTACIGVAASLFLFLDWVCRYIAQQAVQSASDSVSVELVGSVMIFFSLTIYAVSLTLMFKVMSKWRPVLEEHAPKHEKA